MNRPGDGARFTQVNFQARSRMRIPKAMLDPTYRIYVVDAIRRHPEIDSENLYEKALLELIQGETSDVLADLSTSIGALLSGALQGKEQATAIRLLDRLSRLDASDDAYLSIAEFNRMFLNENGLVELLTVLIFDGADLDPVAIDKHRGERRFRQLMALARPSSTRKWARPYRACSNSSLRWTRRLRGTL